jgi:osmoprotectant transport system ATP-binding protein
VARALAADPLVLLMDEPFSAVDPVVRSELQEFFLGLQRELGKTIIFITHDIDEAIKLGDQVAIMRVGGHLVQVGTPQQLLNEPADAFVEGFVGRDRGFRSLSFQPASVLSLDRVKVVRDVEAANGASQVLVIDGDARPVGWADPERPGRVFALGSTFSPETDSLRAALDSALTSPHGLAVAVTADTGRYAGVVTADTILAKVRDVRVAIAESISVREAEATLVDETLEESGYEPLGEPAHEPQDERAEAEKPQDELAGGDQAADEPAEPFEAPEEAAAADERAEAYAPADQPAEACAPADQPAEAYPPTDQPAEVYQDPEEPVPADEPVAEQAPPEGADTDDAGDVSPHNGAHPIEDHRTTAGHKGGRETNGEALYRRVSNILQ